MLYLMATHSSQMINYSAEKFTHLYAEKSLFHVEKSSRTFMQISCREKFTHFYAEKSLFHVEKKFTHFHVGELTFGPW